MQQTSDRREIPQSNKWHLQKYPHLTSYLMVKENAYSLKSGAWQGSQLLVYPFNIEWEVPVSDIRQGNEIKSI